MVIVRKLLNGMKNFLSIKMDNIVLISDDSNSLRFCVRQAFGFDLDVSKLSDKIYFLIPPDKISYKRFVHWMDVMKHPVKLELTNMNLSQYKRSIKLELI